MSLAHILSEIICAKADAKLRYNLGSALIVRFNAKVDYNVEEGYRFVDLAIHRAGTTKVYYRHRWDVIGIDDLQYDIQGDVSVKLGRGYRRGADSWTCLSSHESGWRSDGVEGFLKQNEHLITTLCTYRSWYEIVQHFSIGNDSASGSVG